MGKEGFQKLREGVRNAFDLRGPHGPLTEEDYQLLAKLADKVVKRRMTTPAVMFLESVKPLNSVGSQALVFLRPFIEGFLNTKDYDRMAEILDRREGLDALVKEIEKAEEAHGKEEKK